MPVPTIPVNKWEIYVDTDRNGGPRDGLDI